MSDGAIRCWMSTSWLWHPLQYSHPSQKLWCLTQCQYKACPALGICDLECNLMTGTTSGELRSPDALRILRSYMPDVLLANRVGSGVVERSCGVQLQQLSVVLREDSGGMDM